MPSRADMLENAAEMIHDAATEVRRDHDVLVSICQLLEENLAELRHIRAAIGATGSVSSVELEVDSKTAVKPHVKVYDLDAGVASEQAQALFDDLIIKYGPKSGGA
jgi:hypothetical protein